MILVLIFSTFCLNPPPNAAEDYEQDRIYQFETEHTQTEYAYDYQL